MDGEDNRFCAANQSEAPVQISKEHYAEGFPKQKRAALSINRRVKSGTQAGSRISPFKSYTFQVTTQGNRSNTVKWGPKRTKTGLFSTVSSNLGNAQLTKSWILHNEWFEIKQLLYNKRVNHSLTFLLQYKAY